MPWLGSLATKQIGRGFFGVPAHCCLYATKNFQQHKVSLTLVLSNGSQQIECNVFFIEAILNEACVVVSSHSVSVIP